MPTSDVFVSLQQLFAELSNGPTDHGGAYVLNSGDRGLLQSLDKLTAKDASQCTNGGATIAAHVQHLRFGLSLMNRWAAEGGNPFADARWDDAWKVGAVREDEWDAIRAGLAEEAQRWLAALGTTRPLSQTDLNGMIGSVAHLAYHIGAIRQIAKGARGPKEGTFA